MSRQAFRPRRAVALLVESSNGYARGLLRGVISFMREHGAWTIHHSESHRGEDPPPWLEKWRGHGIIGRIENQATANAVLASGAAVVDVSAARLVPNLPWVETDDAGISRHAMDHLLQRGFRRVAFCGDPNYNWSVWRCEAFAEFARAAGIQFFDYQSPLDRRLSPQEEQAALGQWLANLPRPVGIMACYDGRGRQLLEACRQQRIAVPEEIAVIGVDNDELLCELSDPPLSSVIPDTHRTGYVAASLLDRLMSRAEVSSLEQRIAPLGVAVRRSTDVLAIEDRQIVKALRFIREHACERIKVQDVLREVPLSRRVLESRFKKLLGRTPHEEIVRLQVERVRELLQETDLPLETIAQRARFKHHEYMSVVFKRETGLRPSEYRRRVQRGGSIAWQ